MKAIVTSCVIGVLGFSEDGKLAEKALFPKDASKIAERLADLESGKAVGEISTLVVKMRKKGYTTFVFENAEIAQTLREELGIEAEVGAPSGAGKTLLGNLGELAVAAGFLKDPSEMTRLTHDVSMELSRAKVRKATEKRDLLVIQAIQAADDLDKMLNLFMGRIREWYGLHFPELDRIVEAHETYARFVRNLGRRDGFTAPSLEAEGMPKKKASLIADAAERSMGADLDDDDLAQIQTLCGRVLGLYEERAGIDKYVDKLMGEVAPSTRALAGPMLGARLIAVAGGLSNLAKMPASTVQVLGAEKALFRSLTTGARPPKHGIIFQHALVHGAKRWQRGKIARVFAGKLAIAIRSDAFSGNFIGERLKEDLTRRVEEIKKKYAEPKPVEKNPQRMRSARDKRRGKRWKRYGRQG